MRKKVLIIVVSLFGFLSVSCSNNVNSMSSNNDNNFHNYNGGNDPLFNESEEDVKPFGFPEDDDRYGTSYSYYKTIPEYIIGYSGGWTLTYCEENEIVMCSVYYANNLPVIGIGDGIYSIKESQIVNNGVYHGIADNGDKIKSIKLSKNLKYINRNAFRGCTGLKSIYIPSSVIFIDDHAFRNCSNLTIYCQASSQPSSWSDKWNSSNCKVVWNS